MFNIGPAELLVVLVIALLVLGPNKLPDAARQVGRALGEMRKLSSGFQAEMQNALKEPVEGKPTKSSTKPAAEATGGSLSAPRPPAGDMPGEATPVAEVAVPDVGVSESPPSEGVQAEPARTPQPEPGTPGSPAN
ncbi:MAG: Sec-independent protein translocase protein TatB [Actinomycetota bacterium]|nr:Sec-independent protein translocase protein TatB [Actinomycetota bacterium]